MLFILKKMSCFPQTIKVQKNNNKPPNKHEQYALFNGLRGEIIQGIG
jgi:hypothetical protein